MRLSGGNTDDALAELFDLLDPRRRRLVLPMRLNWKSALGIVLSAGLLVWTLRNESAIRDLVRALAVEPAAACARRAGGNVDLPAARDSAGVSSSIRRRPTLPIGALWRSIAIGMMVNNIYPRAR
jgi:hypothetical protein